MNCPFKCYINKCDVTRVLVFPYIMDDSFSPSAFICLIWRTRGIKIYFLVLHQAAKPIQTLYLTVQTLVDRDCISFFDTGFVYLFVIVIGTEM